MGRVLALVKAIEAAASESPDSRTADELRAATGQFAGGIEPEQVVEIAHAADGQGDSLTAEEAVQLFHCYSGGPIDSELLDRITPKLEAIAGKELAP
jgi:hypothetical protein